MQQARQLAVQLFAEQLVIAKIGADAAENGPTFANDIANDLANDLLANDLANERTILSNNF